MSVSPLVIENGEGFVTHIFYCFCFVETSILSLFSVACALKFSSVRLKNVMLLIVWHRCAYFYLWFINFQCLQACIVSVGRSVCFG